MRDGWLDDDDDGRGGGGEAAVVGGDGGEDIGADGGVGVGEIKNAVGERGEFVRVGEQDNLRDGAVGIGGGNIDEQIGGRGEDGVVEAGIRDW